MSRPPCANEVKSYTVLGLEILVEPFKKKKQTKNHCFKCFSFGFVVGASEISLRSMVYTNKNETHFELSIGLLKLIAKDSL